MNFNSTPLTNEEIKPLAFVVQRFENPRSYRSSKEIESIAIESYRSNGKGIAFATLLEKGIAHSKKQAQNTLKYHVRTGVLFALTNTRPQQYYPTCLKSEIMKAKLQNYTNERIGVPFSVISHYSLLAKGSAAVAAAPLSQCCKYIRIHTLEDYVLPLLPEAPLFLHNLRFKTKIVKECYSELNLRYHKKNNGKYHQGIIGKTMVEYILYANGTVDIFTTCSNHPYRIETEEDRFRLVVFFGQIRAGLINLLNDKHERIVQDISEWELIECDLNKDIKVSDLLHYNGIKIRVKHFDHLFGVYIKAMGKDTVCRVEENRHFKKSLIDSINNIFNPTEKLEKRVDAIYDIVCRLAGQLKIEA
jgi:hypothetical protein